MTTYNAKLDISRHALPASTSNCCTYMGSFLPGSKLKNAHTALTQIGTVQDHVTLEHNGTIMKVSSRDRAEAFHQRAEAWNAKSTQLCECKSSWTSHGALDDVCRKAAHRERLASQLKTRMSSLSHF